MSRSESQQLREDTNRIRELAEKLRDTRTHIRREVAESLAQLANDDEDATAALLSAIYDEDSEIRMLAFSAVKTVAMRSIRFREEVRNLTRDLTQTKRVLAEVIAERSGSEEEPQRLQAELERSNRDLDQFAYIVSHDLQSPLRTITGYCQLLQRRYGGQLDHEADEFLNGTIEGASRMRRLLDDLLAYSLVTTETRRFVPTDYGVVLDEVRNNLETQIHETDAQLTTDPLPIMRAV